jgi:valyl-tRNA synthetase
MPFLTEEIWQIVAERSPEEALIVSTWPELKSFDANLISDFESTAEVLESEPFVKTRISL